jgi:rhamnose utilization protein RhaD (predicted bifunctional aldolase and dehydrogenase)
MGLQELVELSREYGANEEYVLSGGGNTSYKTEKHLYIKASGFKLATIDQDGFAKMRLDKLETIWEDEYPEEPSQRESRFLADIMDAREQGEDKRPSVETLLHAIFPSRYVFHMHPALVNGLTCSWEGEAAVKRIFGEQAGWVPTVNPGYILAKTVREILSGYTREGKEYPPILFLQNHGLFVAHDDIQEIDRLHEKVMTALKNEVKRFPDLTPTETDKDRVREVETFLRNALAVPGKELQIKCIKNREIDRFISDREAFQPLSSAYTPDHIVYYGHEPLFLHEPPSGASSEETGSIPTNQWLEEVERYVSRNNEKPRIVTVENLGVFSCNQNASKTETAAALFLDAVKIAVYAESFGGPQFLPADQIEFIRSWEAEQYRSKVSFDKE